MPPWGGSSARLIPAREEAVAFFLLINPYEKSLAPMAELFSRTCWRSQCPAAGAEPDGSRVAANVHIEESKMPRGDKSTYTDKQKRQAEHIEEGYEKRGVPEDEAARRAWATVNKMTGGGKKSGSGRGKKTNTAPAKKGGHKGGAGSAARSFAERSASAKKAAQTRKRRAAAAHS